MKNYVPLAVAVLLALAAVVAVKRIIGTKAAGEQTVAVVVATREIRQGEVLDETALGERKVPLSARPVQATPWSMRARLVGQKVNRFVAVGDYVLLTDTETGASLVGEGEWAVALYVSGDGIASLVQPGDEVAIIGTFEIKEAVPSVDATVQLPPEAKIATMVLFPRVRVLNVGSRGTEAGEEHAGELIVGLKPSEAQVLIAAQQRYKLTLALRKRGDETAIDRVSIGMVNEQTFEALFREMEPITLPRIPGVGPLGSEKQVSQ